MIIKKELIKREIAGDVILVPVGRTVLENNGLFVLNELGAFLWDLLPEAQSAEDLTKAVLAEYEAEESIVRQDVEEFLDTLRKMQII